MKFISKFVFPFFLPMLMSDVSDQPGAIQWLRPAVQQLGGLVPDHLAGLQHHVVQLQPITDEC